MSTTRGRPTVEEVAHIIRARTKDSNQVEVGTFDEETRPTGHDVEAHIDAAVAIVGLSIPPVDRLDDAIIDGVAAIVALEAACRIEKSYFPEQIRTDRSAYTELRAEADAARQALLDAIARGAGTGSEVTVAGFGSLSVGSWTSIDNWCLPPVEPVEPVV